jgi:DNA-directed RNA polymerase subunit RPC12/RpoP
MAESDTRTKCLNCGFEATPARGEWERVELPRLGAVARCPECGSTDTTTLG